MSKQIAAAGLDSLVLSDIAHVEMGQSPDSRYVVEDPLVGLAFLQGNAEFGAVYPEPKFGCLRPAKTCKANDVLISVRAPVGAVNLADRDYCIGRGLAAIRGRGIKPSLLGEVVARQSAALRRVAQGTTFEAISKNDLLTLKLSLPPRTDWPQIAQILDTLDTAIHETEAIIAKLKAVKQGLLHDLLTCGIDANGELRPPQAEAPHLYKQSPLGWIPREWDVRGVLDVAPADRQCILTGPFGAELGRTDFKEEGVPVLRIGNVQAGYIDWSDTQFVTPEKARRLDKYRVATGDLLFARQGATTGRNALADLQADGALINYHIIRVAIDHAKCHPTYLYALFNSASAKSQVDKSKGRGTREGINSEQISSLAFALPKPDEQNEAVARIASIEASISNEYMLLEKLQLEKSGLMDDLLTGRVRVTPLLAADPEGST